MGCVINGLEEDLKNAGVLPESEKKAEPLKEEAMLFFRMTLQVRRPSRSGSRKTGII